MLQAQFQIIFKVTSYKGRRLHIRFIIELQPFFCPPEVDHPLGGALWGCPHLMSFCFRSFPRKAFLILYTGVFCSFFTLIFFIVTAGWIYGGLE